jgi:hypothetical protein
VESGRGRVQESARAEGPDSARMTLLVELEEFVQDHQSHGGITGDATPPAWNGYLLTVTCPCGVVFERWVTQRTPCEMIACEMILPESHPANLTEGALLSK